MAHLEKAVIIEDDPSRQEQHQEEDTSDWNVSTKKQRGGRKQKGVPTTNAPISNNAAFSSMSSSSSRKKTTPTSTTGSSTTASVNVPKKKTSGSNPHYEKKMNQQFGSTSSNSASSSSTDKTLHPPHYSHERTITIPAKVDPRFLVGEKGSFANEVKKQSGISWYSVKNMTVVLGGSSEESVLKAEELVQNRIGHFSMTHFSETFSTLVIPELAERLDAENQEEIDLNEYDIALRPFTCLAVYSSQPNSTFSRMILKKEGESEDHHDDAYATSHVVSDAHHDEAHAGGDHNTHHKEMTLMNKKTKEDMLDKIATKLVDIELRKNESEVLSVKALYGQLLAYKATKDTLKIPELLEMKHGKDIRYHFNRIIDKTFYEKLKSNLKYIPDEDATIVAIYFGKPGDKPKEEDNSQPSEKNETITFEVNKATGKLEQIKKNEHTRNYYTLNYVTPITKERSNLNDFKITIASYVPNDVEQQDKNRSEMDSFLNECANLWNNEKNEFTNPDFLKNPPSPYRFKGTIVKFKKHYHSEDGSIKVTLHEIHDLDTKAVNFEVVVVSEELYRSLDDKDLKPSDKKKKYKESLEKLTDWLFTHQ
nr:unnamed protein product [Naegleria fowleri]